jgi:hypothetical protein
MKMGGKHKKACIIFLAGFIIAMNLCLSACWQKDMSKEQEVLSPSHCAPIGGKWVAHKEWSFDGESFNDSIFCEGKSLQLINDTITFEGIQWKDVSYKIKLVDKVDYLKSKNASSLDLLSEEIEKVEVITINTSDKYLCELMIIDDKHMVLFIRERCILFKKISDIDDSIAETSIGSLKKDSPTQKESISGILIGLRTEIEGAHAYSTLFIAKDREGLRPMLMADDLFFPRTSGFWELKFKNFEDGMTKGDTLEIRNVASSDINLNHTVDLSETIIHYLGNDYISIERNYNSEKRLQILPIDNLSSHQGLEIVDLFGNEGKLPYLDARDEAIEKCSMDGETVVVQESTQLEDFGIKRESGRWGLKGRINYRKKGIPNYFDYDLNLAIPEKVIFYDTLVLSWLKIKDRIPNADDALTSPNKDIALIKSKDRLVIYAININQLDEESLGEINLPKNTEIVMAEWATGSYVESWEKSFISNGAKPVN